MRKQDFFFFSVELDERRKYKVGGRGLGYLLCCLYTDASALIGYWPYSTVPQSLSSSPATC